MSAMIATADPSHDSGWYIDSGASNHITSNPQNLMSKTEYNGQEVVHVGNGTDLHIHSIGYLLFNPPILNPLHYAIYFMSPKLQRTS